MSYKLALELLQPAVRETANRVAELYRRLDGLGRLDYQSGRVEIDEEQINTILAEFFPTEVAERHFQVFRELAQDGFALLGPDEDVGAEGVLALPWTVINHFIETKGTLPGGWVTMPITLDSAREALQKRFPNIPEAMLDNEKLKRLVMLPRNGEGGPDIDLPGDPPPDDPPSRPGTTGNTGSTGVAGGVFGVTDFSDTEIGQFVDCFFNPVNWRLHWWGWEVCLNQECATIVAEFLLPGPFGRVKDVISEVVMSKGYELPGLTVSLASIALMVYGILLSANIFAVNGPNGVCIQANWPSPWVGMFIWAVPQ
jgi:hypothetical protein